MSGPSHDQALSEVTIPSKGESVYDGEESIMEEYEEIVGKYKLIECIGHGAQAKVYRACEKDTQKEVAIKICDVKKTKEWKDIELFKREAEILQKVDIEGITKCIDYIEGKSKYYSHRRIFRCAFDQNAHVARVSRNDRSDCMDHVFSCNDFITAA